MRPTAKCSLLALAALLLAGGAARADWLLTRDGARVETKGPWKVEGRRVLFTQPDGTFSMLRSEEVDLDASAAATAEAIRLASAPPAPPVKREPVLRLTEKEIPPMEPSAEEAPAGEAAEGGAAGSGLDVISWDKTTNATGDGLEIFGTIKNLSANMVTSPTVLVAIYDEEGGLLGTNNGVVNAPSIQPGKTANFRVAFPGIPDFAAVKFDAQGVGFKVRNPATAEGADEGVEESAAPGEEEPMAEEPPLEEAAPPEG